MPKKSKKTQEDKDKIDIEDIDTSSVDVEEEQESEEAIEVELAPDIAKALTPNKKISPSLNDIDYIPDTDLMGAELEESDEEEF